MIDHAAVRESWKEIGGFTCFEGRDSLRRSANEAMHTTPATVVNYLMLSVIYILLVMHMRKCQTQS